MKLIDISIADLVFDPNNARKHPITNINAIKGSLAKFGQQKAIVIDKKNIVIAGNGTLAAAKELGWKTIKATVTDLDDLNKMAFALADNRTSELAIWDTEELNQQLAQLDLNDFDISDIGFDEADFKINDDIEPEKKEDDKDSIGDNKFDIIIKLKSEEEQKRLFEEFIERGLECVIL